MDPREALTHALPRFLRRCDAVSTRKAYKRELHRFLADWEMIQDEVRAELRMIE